MTTTTSSQPVFTIYYWPFKARASGLFRMLVESDVSFEHLTDRGAMPCALWGQSSTNLAPPIIVDHQAASGKSLTLSQAVPCHAYIGTKLGLDKGIDVPEIAQQYMQDWSDWHSELAEKAVADRKDNGISALKQHIMSDRYKMHLQAINRSIKGPYYFGETPTYVDFALCSYLDMACEKWLDPLLPKSGDTLTAHAPKAAHIYQQLCRLPSASKLDHLLRAPASLVIPHERVAMWDTTESHKEG